MIEESEDAQPRGIGKRLEMVGERKRGGID
jgi:hypothetical protein